LLPSVKSRETTDQSGYETGNLKIEPDSSNLYNFNANCQELDFKIFQPYTAPSKTVQYLPASWQVLCLLQNQFCISCLN